MNLTQVGCPHCERPIEPLDGGPDRHGRFGWYVALARDVDGPWSQLIVYATQDTKESALHRARLLLQHRPELAAYAHRTPLPTTPNSLTCRGGDIERQKLPEGIA